MRRPLLMAGLLYAGGILIGNYAPLPPFWLLGISLAVAIIALTWARARPGLLCLLAFLAGWTNLERQTVVLSPYDLRRILGDQAAIVSVRGILIETPGLRFYEHEAKEAWRTMARVEVSAVSTNHEPWQPATGRLAVTTSGALTNLFAGQTVEIDGVAARPKLAAAEGTFDYRAYLSELGIHYQLKADSAQDWHILRSPDAPPLADRFRDWGRRALALGLPVEDRPGATFHLSTSTGPGPPDAPRPPTFNWVNHLLAMDEQRKCKES